MRRGRADWRGLALAVSLVVGAGLLAAGAPEPGQVVETEGAAAPADPPEDNIITVRQVGGGGEQYPPKPVEGVVDLNVAKNIECTRARLGPELVCRPGPVVIVLAVGNTGPDAATTVVVTDVLFGPLEITVLPPECDQEGNTITCVVDSIPPFTAVNLFLEGAIEGQGEFGDTLTAKADQPDPTPGNNTITVTATVV